MLDELVKAYSEYFKLDVLNGFQTVQEVVDNMLTRLEELSSVLNMVKMRNVDCSSAVSDDITKYRTEITILSKKITVLQSMIQKLHVNMDMLEKQVEKAELDFGVHHDNKIKNFLKPFLKKRESPTSSNITAPFEKLTFESVASSFEDKISNV